MDHHEEAICLARTANGFVKICPPGCTHATFGGVTCNFEGPAEFQGFAVSVPLRLGELPPGENLRFDHNGIVLELSRGDAEEFSSLVNDAAATLAWASGEMEFGDEDFQQILKRLSS